MVKLTLGFPPSNNHYKRHFCTKRENKNGDHVISAALTERAKQFKYDAGYLAKAAGCRAYEGPIHVIIDAYCPQTTTDIDNIPKMVFDALNHVAWEDDSQVVRLLISRHLDPRRPRLELELTYLGSGD